jgi:hypothetical protein
VVVVCAAAAATVVVDRGVAAVVVGAAVEVGLAARLVVVARGSVVLVATSSAVGVVTRTLAAGERNASTAMGERMARLGRNASSPVAQATSWDHNERLLMPLPSVGLKLTTLHGEGRRRCGGARRVGRRRGAPLAARTGGQPEHGDQASRRCRRAHQYRCSARATSARPSRCRSRPRRVHRTGGRGSRGTSSASPS